MTAAKKRPARKAGPKKPLKRASKPKRSSPAAETPLLAAAAPSGPRERRRVGLPTPAAVDAPVAPPEPSYFASGNGKESLRFVSSGCAVKDEALGGGWVLGRVANIVGDRSAGKTLDAMEAVANFAIQYPKGWMRYAESEAAFDMGYAQALGIPVDRVEFNPGGTPMRTVEDLYEDMVRCLDSAKAKKQTEGMYIIDSLDALSDDVEMEADFNKATYGGAKPKALGQLFRRLVERFGQQQVLVVVVSQIRDVLNARPFQETKTRSGGKALDFYATHIVWLHTVGKIKKTIGGVERVIGIDAVMKIRKNKVGLPFREAKYPILFGYGIDDMAASVEWLLTHGLEDRLKLVGMSKAGWSLRVAKVRNEGGAEAKALRLALAQIVRSEWAKLETTFLPKASKY